MSLFPYIVSMSATLAYSIQFCNHILNQTGYENSLRMNTGVGRDTSEKDDKFTLVSLQKKGRLRGDLFTASAYFHGERTMDTEGLEAEAREMRTGSKAQLFKVVKVINHQNKTERGDMLSLDIFTSMVENLTNSSYRSLSVQK